MTSNPIRGMRQKMQPGTIAGNLTNSARQGHEHTVKELALALRPYIGSAAAVSTTGAAGGGGGTGDVSGPSGAVDSDFAQFDGTTGKLIKDGGLSLDTDGTFAANSDAHIPSQKAVKTYVTAHAGTGTVITTGTPAAGNLTKFSGATSITNGDLSGDVTTSGTLAATLAASGVTAGSYGDSTHVPSVTFDAKGRATGATSVAIASGGGVGGTGYHWPCCQFVGNDLGSFATLGNEFILAESIRVTALYGAFNAANIGDVYSMFIATLDGSNNINGTVATASSRFTTVATGAQQHKFVIPATTLSAATKYYFGIVITSGTGTTPCRANGPTSTGSYATLPIDMGASVAAFTQCGHRRWFAQNSDAPTSAAFVSSSSGSYAIAILTG